jgi:hypothetical protein
VILAAVSVALPAAALVWILGHERALQQADHARVTSKRTPDVWWKDEEAKPIVRPPTFSMNEAQMLPGEMVIGVEVGGKARAYRLDAFQTERGHLVNDLIAGVPVSVAYCNLTDCLRVYTDSKSSGPLDIEIAGVLEGEMVVKIGGSFYFQKSGMPVEPGKISTPVPYTLLTSTRTTWAEWTKRHPETDVYVGDRRDSPGRHPELIPGPTSLDGQDEVPAPAIPALPLPRPEP